jgi:hypothetical protein
VLGVLTQDSSVKYIMFLLLPNVYDDSVASERVAAVSEKIALLSNEAGGAHCSNNFSGFALRDLTCAMVLRWSLSWEKLLYIGAGGSWGGEPGR